MSGRYEKMFKLNHGTENYYSDEIYHIYIGKNDKSEDTLYWEGHNQKECLYTIDKDVNWYNHFKIHRSWTLANSMT